MENLLESKNEEHSHEKELEIIINGREKKWGEKKISFDQVVELAFGGVSSNPNTTYTVTYKRGHGEKPEGSMVKGDIIKVKKGMIFNVTATDKS
jgi:Multiubiquitin